MFLIAIKSLAFQYTINDICVSQFRFDLLLTSCVCNSSNVVKKRAAPVFLFPKSAYCLIEISEHNGLIKSKLAYNF